MRGAFRMNPARPEQWHSCVNQTRAINPVEIPACAAYHSSIPSRRNSYVKAFRMTLPLALACVVSACAGGSKSSTSPTTTTTNPVTLVKPFPDSPDDNAALGSVRPTLSIVNSTTTSTSGAKMYEFEISDKSDTGKDSAFLTRTLVSPQVAEDTSGKTKFTVSQDLVQGARYYWHARLVQ